SLCLVASTTSSQTYTLSLHDALPILIDATGRPVVISGFSEISFTEPPPEPPAPRHRNGTARAPGGEPAEAAAAPWSDELDRADRSEEHTSELQSRENLVCRLLLEKKE